MNDIINLFLNQIVLSLLVLLNNANQDTLKLESIRLIDDGTVTRVIDGDTIEIFENNSTYKVRLIGVDTPESVDPRKEVECYGLEASLFLKKELEGRVVELVNDPSQEDKDTYGRLLRYVYLDNNLINQKIIEEGYGFEYTFKKPHQFQKEFKEAEENAKTNNKGLWNKSNCNY